MKIILQKFSKFRIPTFLGLGIILAGIITGVFLILKDQQPFFAKADLNFKPEPIVTNILSDSVTISFKTEASIPAFINYGINSIEENGTRDDRDTDKPPAPRQIHYFTIKNLQPDTAYQYRVTVGKSKFEIQPPFKTAKAETLQNGFNPIIGTVLSGNTPLNEGLVYLTIANAKPQSALVKNNGNFLIPLTFIRKEDLSDVLVPEDKTPAKLTIISAEGEAMVLLPLKADSDILDAIRLGDKLDLTDPNPSPTPDISPKEIITFDLNGDGQINAADNAIILKNFGNNPSNKKADLDGNGKVDNEDLKIMAEKISEQN
ncbi:hypothetical protein HYS92_00765 [Candidatus Daviesbacteria bacterium]|nr:hypothetical protein [Candidatus Daviesbacteria bacterium]